MKFELEAKVMNGKVVTNAKELLANIDEGLKSYNYVVTTNTYEQAKKDRATLNKVVKMVSDERKRIENDLFSEWKSDKADIMSIEKKIKEYSDSLGEGIKSMDEEEKLEKKKQIEELWSNISNDKFRFDLVFDEKYLNKSTSAKSIEEDLQKKYKIACEHEGFMDTFLPEDEFEAEQVKEVFYNTLDLTRAKVKADDLKRLREQVQKAVETKKQEQKIEDIVVERSETHLESEPQAISEEKELSITFNVKGSEETIKALNYVLGSFMKEHKDLKLQVVNKGE